MTDKFNPDSGASGTPSIPRPTNWSEGSVNFIGPDGRVVKSATPDANGQVRYTTTVGSKGINGVTGRFTGNGITDTSYFHATDANGYGATQSIAGTVDQIVAGPGIYISSPNGQGVVTVSLHPLPTQVNVNTLYDVVWTYDANPTRPFGVVGEFIAVGAGGTNMKSRDANNWSQLFPANTTIVGVSAEINSSIPDGHVEYNGVGLGGNSIYGRVGFNKDSMTSVNQLSDQTGLISENLISTFIFAATTATSTSTTGGGGSPPIGGGTGSLNFTVSNVRMEAGGSGTTATNFTTSDYVNIYWTTQSLDLNAYPNGYNPVTYMYIDNSLVLSTAGQSSGGSILGGGARADFEYVAEPPGNGYWPPNQSLLGTHTVTLEFYDGNPNPGETPAYSVTKTFTIS